MPLKIMIADDDPETTLALPAKASGEAPAWRQIVRDCVDLVPLIECEDLGERMLKNVDRPLRLFRVA